MIKTASGNVFFHKCGHQELLQDMAFGSLSLEAKGALFMFRLMCGHTNNNGSIKYGSIKRMNKDDAVQFLASQPGSNIRKAEDIINQLVGAGRILVDRHGAIMVAWWKEEQELGRTKWAVQKRRQRAGDAGENLSEFGENLSEFGGDVPPPPPPVQPSACSSAAYAAQGAIAPKVDMSAREKRTCPPRNETETENQNEEFRTESLRISLNPDAEAEPKADDPSGQGRSASAQSRPALRGQDTGGGGGGTGPHGLTEEDIWVEDPIRVALALCHEHGKFPENVWRKRIVELAQLFGGKYADGVEAFRQCMQALACMIREDRVKGRRSQALNGIINARLRGEAP